MEKNDSSRGRASSKPVGGVKMPEGALARDARKTAETLLPGVLNRHAQRVFNFSCWQGGKKHSYLMPDYYMWPRCS